MVKKKRVLFYDYEPYLSRALADNLEPFGWKVTLVFDIDELFFYLQNHQYDIVILDIMAPVPETATDFVNFTNAEINEMNNGIDTGIVLAKKIWRNNSDIPILFLSARSQPDAISQFNIERKRCEYLKKPELSITINEILNKLLNL